MSSFIDLTGHVYGRLTVKCLDGGPSKKTYWICECSCGEMKAVWAGHLRNGHTTSCGCFRREAISARSKLHNRTHGLHKTAEYRSWQAMIARCTNPDREDFERYGGRGITVCERWMNSVQAFVDDMGTKPSAKHSIERIENSGNYEPGNCRWATAIEQAVNRRSTRLVTLEGETLPITHWAKRLGIATSTVYNRLERGFTPEEALGK